jgi:polar amino acid transport system substrate-binding protein
MLYIKLITTLVCLTCISALYAKKFIVNTQEWPPYQVYQGNHLEGTATKVVKCVLSHMKLDYQINVLPWKRAQEEVRSDHAQAFYSAGITKERDNYAIPTKQIANYKWYWFLAKNSTLEPESPKFKQNSDVAAKFGTGLESFLKENNYRLVASPKEIKNLLEMLEAKRFDAFLSPKEPAMETMKKMNLDKNKFKIIFHSNNVLVFYFSKKYVSENKNAVHQFNSFIKKCGFPD